METRSLLPENGPIALIDADTEERLQSIRVVATRDHALIRQWAARRHAEPATGEATESGPSTMTVNDDGTGIRFNFPGIGRYAFNAIQNSDLPVIQGTVLVGAFFIVMMSLLVDILYAFIDPRVRY